MKGGAVYQVRAWVGVSERGVWGGLGLGTTGWRCRWALKRSGFIAFEGEIHELDIE
jgi:hypothetical protein